MVHLKDKKKVFWWVFSSLMAEMMDFLSVSMRVYLWATLKAY